jgi:hypothetical protein
MFNGKKYKIEKDDVEFTTSSLFKVTVILKTYKSLTILGKIVYAIPFAKDLIKTLYNIYKYGE